MEFSNYIKELLIFNDCVIIPGFGGFITKYKPAIFDQAQSSFFPPSKELVFNARLIHNDGLFINYIAVVNRLSYKEARDVFSGFTGNLFSELESGKTVVFNEIGCFKYDDNKSIVFEADLKFNLLAEAYGLSTFSFPVVEQADFPVRIEQKIRESGGIREFLLHPLAKAVIISVPVLAALTYLTIKTDIAGSLKEKYFSVNDFIADTVRDFRDYTSKEIFNNPNSMEASLALQTNKYFALFYREPAKQENNMPGNKETKEPVSAPANHVQTGKTPISETVTENKTVIETENLNKTAPVTVKDQVREKEINKTDILVSTDRNKYYLVAGSFGNIDNARAMSRQVNGKGYHSEILTQKNGLYRVSVKSFTDRNAAAGELTSINAKNTDFTVWILGEK